MRRLRGASRIFSTISFAQQADFGGVARSPRISPINDPARASRGSIDTSPYYVAVIITLAIISAASGNLGPRPGPCFYTPEVG
jgi:hypothetical protein